MREVVIKEANEVASLVACGTRLSARGVDVELDYWVVWFTRFLAIRQGVVFFLVRIPLPRSNPNTVDCTAAACRDRDGWY